MGFFSSIAGLLGTAAGTAVGMPELGALAGSAIGGLAGGGKQKSTSVTTPNLSPEQIAGYKYANTQALDLAKQPYAGPPTMRYSLAGPFASPIIAALQQRSDKAHLTAPPPEAAPAAATPAANPAQGDQALIQQLTMAGQDSPWTGKTNLARLAAFYAHNNPGKPNPYLMQFQGGAMQ